ncbi:MAG: D-amino-acid transaminase [Proteobacteria bacterium]|nr:D-amino-acid transaminase [Pseudomonadota bacterium]
MPRIAYVNGHYLPFGEAGVHIEDRGLQFADAVYEVVAVVDGVLADLDAHMARLARSLHEIRIENAPRPEALIVAMRQTIRRNRVTWGLLYIQIGRGVASRDHGFPTNVKPGVVITCKSFDYKGLAKRLAEGVSVKTMADERWDRPDIKSVSLLPNVLAKQAAREVGAYEAWLVDKDGYVTEGSSTNAWIVTDGKTLVTRALSGAILPGITRQIVMQMADAEGFVVEERPFTAAEAQGAKEAFLTSSSGGPVAVVRIDDQPVGNGVPGEVAGRLAAAYKAHLASMARDPDAAVKKLSGL